MVHLVHLFENDLFDMLNEVASVVIQASKYVIIFLNIKIDNIYDVLKIAIK